jgi:hypothetical protein
VQRRGQATLISAGSRCCLSEEMVLRIAYCVQGSAAQLLPAMIAGGMRWSSSSSVCDWVSSRVLVLFCKFSSVIGAFLTSRTIQLHAVSMQAKATLDDGPIRDTWLFTALVFSWLKNRKSFKFKKIGSGDIN